MKKKIEVSIIIVHFKVKKELFDCLNSIYSSNPKLLFEIIVVDNDEIKSIGKELKKKFPKVKYIENKNNGFGAGNNLGAKYAKGDYLFFLNPDTLLVGNPIDKLFSFAKKNKNLGAAAPLILNERGISSPMQGAKDLTPMRAIFTLSFLSKLFPNNKIRKNYWQLDWNKKTNKSVSNVPGTAFVIKKTVFEKIEGFDERFFLYFEEFDLCKRLVNKGYKNFIIPGAKVIHLWERSTSQRSDKDEIFEKSRKYFFKKHYGFILGKITDFFVGFGKKDLILTSIIAISIILRFYQLSEKMSFFGDIAWFYISARDLIIAHTIPLVGITTSHIWLHQGPLWTYILAILLSISNFNPIAGAYFTSFIGVLTVYAVYKTGKLFYSVNVGLISAFLYATSPLIIAHARMPFITSVIPFLASLLLLAVFFWLKGKKNYFFAAFALMLLLYNFELATQALWIIILFFLVIGFIKKDKFLYGLNSIGAVIKIIIIFLVIMFPILLYDVANGFSQTFKFAAWIPYKFLNLFVKFKPFKSETSFLSIFNFLSIYNQKLFFYYSSIVSTLMFAVMVLNSYFEFLRNKKEDWYKSSVLVLTSFTIIPILGILITKTPSEAYLPIIFSSLIVLSAASLNKLMNVSRIKYIVLFVIILLGFSNSLVFINNDKNFYYGAPLDERITAAKKIIKIAGGKEYNIIGSGPGSEFASFTMNYEYLGWWLGNAPSPDPQNLKFIVNEEHGNITFSVKK